MRLIFLTCLAMTAFASNSILNRYALTSGDWIGPVTFSALRVLSGALVLFILIAMRQNQPAKPSFAPIAVFSLSTYMFAFSLAYVSIEAGVGALLLFGTVQVTMFCGAIVKGATPSFMKWFGMFVSMAGLFVLTAPSAHIDMGIVPVALMVLAGIAWGIYSLAGQSVTDPIQATAWNFIWSAPISVVLVLLWGLDEPITLTGAALAMTAGGVSSALGYALWYAIVPTLGSVSSALSQLSVPVITLVIGALFLGEALTLQSSTAAVIILCGILLGLYRPKVG